MALRPLLSVRIGHGNNSARPPTAMKCQSSRHLPVADAHAAHENKRCFVHRVGKNCSSRRSRAISHPSTCTAARRLNFGVLMGSGASRWLWPQLAGRRGGLLYAPTGHSDRRTGSAPRTAPRTAHQQPATSNQRPATSDQSQPQTTPRRPHGPQKPPMIPRLVHRPRPCYDLHLIQPPRFRDRSLHRDGRLR